MNRTLSLLLAAAAGAIVPLLASFTFQDQTKLQDPFAKSAKVSFSQLIYTDSSGQQQTILAKNMTSVRLLQVPDDGMRLEILYQNGDYSLIRPQSFHFINRSDASAVEVFVYRSSVNSMAFPFVY
jgi:hypothetical protein